MKTFIHTVHLLQKLSDIETLPVADILNKLLLMDGGPGQPSAVLGSKHIVCWGFEDLLTINESKEQPNNATQNLVAQPAEKDKGETCFFFFKNVYFLIRIHGLQTWSMNVHAF